MRYSILLLFPTLLISCGDDQPEVQCEDPNPLAACCGMEAIEAEVGAGRVYVPNVFTPDNDGINDILYINANDSIDMVVQWEVVDQDQNIVYQEFDPQLNTPSFGWDGTVDGEVVRGVFSVTLEVLSKDGVTAMLSGEVCSFPCPLGASSVPEFEGLPNCATPSQHNGEGGFDPFLPQGENWECIEF